MFNRLRRWTSRMRYALPVLLGIMLLMTATLPRSALSLDEQASGQRIRILAGTSTVADILEDLFGDAAEIRLLIPGGSCPGHYDLRPSDLRFLGDADALVLESFQPEMQNMRNLVRAADNGRLETYVLPEVESAMLPEAQRRMTLDLAERFSQFRPAIDPLLKRNAAERLARIQAVEDRETARLQQAGIRGWTAICSGMQAQFVSWAGLQVVGVYGRPEDLTPENFEKLQNLGTANMVRIVLDNVQSGPGAGRGLAESLGAGQADLTSFPGALPGENDWASAFTGNVGRVLQAHASRRM